MNQHLRFWAMCCLITVTVFCKAQQTRYSLFIYNRLHNSYEAVVANKPYAIVVNDTATYKGYFDAVYENNFFFATKDSVYLLQPQEIKSVMRIRDFSSDQGMLTFGQRMAEYTCIGISSVSTFIFLPASLALLKEDVSAGLILGAISATLAVGPALIASALVNSNRESMLIINSSPGQRFNNLEVCIQPSAP